ncbi:MAG: hypothetical protein WCT12_28575 [Verrucomicrobiota bacterium]
MKTRNLLLAVCLCFSLSACQTPFGKSVSAWWAKPATQQGVACAEEAATQFAVNAALAALQQWAGGGKLNYQQIALQGGISTLYMQASNIRQLQGTSLVLDPVATAQLLQQGGTPEEISRKLATELVANANALILQTGITPSQAAEINAAALDKSAVVVKTITTP